jgi:hypothetical protein
MEHIQRPRGAGRVGSERVTYAQGDRGERGLMKHDIDPLHRSANRLGIHDIAHHQFDIAFQMPEILAISRGKIIQDSNSVTPLDKCLGDIRTNKARTTRHEIIRHRQSLPFRIGFAPDMVRPGPNVVAHLPATGLRDRHW